jgi:hypothetical protein
MHLAVATTAAAGCWTGWRAARCACWPLPPRQSWALTWRTTTAARGTGATRSWQTPPSMPPLRATSSSWGWLACRTRRAPRWVGRAGWVGGTGWGQRAVAERQRLGGNLVRGRWGAYQACQAGSVLGHRVDLLSKWCKAAVCPVPRLMEAHIVALVTGCVPLGWVGQAGGRERLRSGSGWQLQAGLQAACCVVSCPALRHRWPQSGTAVALAVYAT